MSPIRLVPFKIGYLSANQNRAYYSIRKMEGICDDTLLDILFVFQQNEGAVAVVHKVKCFRNRLININKTL